MRLTKVSSAASFLSDIGSWGYQIEVWTGKLGLQPQKVVSSLDQIVWDCLRQAWPETQMKIKRNYWIFF